MGRFTYRDEGIDPALLTVAAHELGHAFAHKAAGIKVTKIAVSGVGDDARGQVRTQVIEDPTDAQVEGWLVGFLAGREADHLWCDSHGLHLRGKSRFCTDMSLWQEHRRLAPKLTESRASARARRIVLDHWSEIVHLAPALAVNGRISI